MTGQGEHTPSGDAQADQRTVDEPPSSASAAAFAHRRRFRLIGGLCLCFCLIGLFWAGYWFFVLRFEESTDDAYVAGNLVRVSSQVSGSVREILADNTQAVAVGQVLVRLDGADASLALERARSSLADTVRQTRSLMAESDRLAALVALRQKELDKARGDLARRIKRKTSMAVSEEELSHARDNLAIAGISLEVAQRQLQVNRMLLQDKPLQEQPSVLLRAQLLREAWLALQRCEIRSPVNGYVARRNVQVGAYVTPGAPLMAVAPLDEVWVDANFKEVQLRRMRIGQQARIEADVYGSSFTYRGEVVGFAAGTGSAFSLLPPENATGNWIKVVQRVPVKISLDAEQLAAAPLLIGLSCRVDVAVNDAQGRMLAPLPSGDGAAPGDPLYRTTALEFNTDDIDREIERIILQNAAGS
jgi:membrane fusion protein (multidrug efflux system)